MTFIEVMICPLYQQVTVCGYALISNIFYVIHILQLMFQGMFPNKHFNSNKNISLISRWNNAVRTNNDLCNIGCSSLSWRTDTYYGHGNTVLQTLLKKSLWHRCFPVNIAKILRTPFFIEHLRWLLLCFM